MMNDDSKQAVVSALRKLLLPVVRMMLRNGVTYRDFASLSKNLFVEVAASDFGLRGRPTNVSRIALLTGIDRKEIKRIKDLLQVHYAVNHTQRKTDRMTRLLSAWHQDAEFVDRSGQPRLLPREGATASFAALVRRYGGDVPDSALLKELLRAQVVEEQVGGIKVVKREFIPDPTKPEALLRAGSVLHDLGATLFHNLYLGDGKKIPLRFERRASNRRIDPQALDAFYQLVAKEGQAFLETIDAWLSAHEISDHDSAATQVLRLGVGTYMFEEIEQALPAPPDDGEPGEAGEP